MAYDYFTIRALAREFRSHLVGQRISWVAAGSDVLAFSCHPEKTVVFQYGVLGALHLVTGIYSALSNERGDPERYLLHAEVCGVEASRADRVIRVRLCRRSRDDLNTYGVLIFELIQSHFQAVLVSERTDKVLGKWVVPEKGSRPQRVQVGASYRPPTTPARKLPGEADGGLFRKRLEMGEAPAKALSRTVIGVDRPLAEQLLLHLSVSPASLVADRLDATVRLCWQGLTALFAKPPALRGFAWKDRQEWVFSAFHPVQSAREFDSISEAIAWCREQELAESGQAELEKRVRRSLTRAGRVIARRRAATAADLQEAEQAEYMQRCGDILMAQLDRVPPYCTEIELSDVYDVEGVLKVVVTLDPQLKPVENGRRYLKTAAKYRRRLALLPRRLRKLDQQRSRLEQMIARLADKDKDCLASAEATLRELGMADRISGGGHRLGQEQAHPRRYRGIAGWEIWAGRNNRENDALTHRMAAQNDIWFHAQGYPGSHVVLRRDGRSEEPNRQMLEEAAGVAAYWSKGRTAKKVPVIYTLVKYVSKPRGGTAGKAVTKREKTLIVAPVLPRELAGSVLHTKDILRDNM